SSLCEQLVAAAGREDPGQDDPSSCSGRGWQDQSHGAGRTIAGQRTCSNSRIQLRQWFDTSRPLREWNFEATRSLGIVCTYRIGRRLPLIRPADDAMNSANVKV